MEVELLHQALWSQEPGEDLRSRQRTSLDLWTVSFEALLPDLAERLLDAVDKRRDCHRSSGQSNGKPGSTLGVEWSNAPKISESRSGDPRSSHLGTDCEPL